MKEGKGIKSPLQGKIGEEAFIEALRRQIGAEQMLVIFTRGGEQHNLHYGFCEHELRNFAHLMLDMADDLEEKSHDHI